MPNDNASRVRGVYACQTRNRCSFVCMATRRAGFPPALRLETIKKLVPNRGNRFIFEYFMLEIESSSSFEFKIGLRYQRPARSSIILLLFTGSNTKIFSSGNTEFDFLNPPPTYRFLSSLKKFRRDNIYVYFITSTKSTMKCPQNKNTGRNGEFTFR